MVKDMYTRDWIIENSKEIVSQYYSGITIRQLYYRLVADKQMAHDVNHYKRVVTAMTEARWRTIIDSEAFIDRERSMYGETKSAEKDIYEEIRNAKDAIKAWMTAYYLNRWSNQPNYVEVWIEKKALQGVFEGPCMGKGVGLAPCKGYPSVTFLHDAAKRFRKARDEGKNLIMLYFGDYDPSGADIPRSIKENLARMGIDVTVKRMALNQDQIEEMGLPGIPPKITDTRTRNWTGGDIVELDAIEPKQLEQMCRKAIDEQFDKDLYDDLEDKEEEERKEYTKALKDFVQDMTFDDDEDDEE